MRLAFFCATLFISTFLVHVVWWRIRLPTRQLTTLLLLFLGTLFVAVLVAAVDRAPADGFPSNVAEWLHVGIVYVPVSLAYVATYSAIEEDSPSLRIVRFVAESGDFGRSREDLLVVLNDDVLVGSRMQAMVRDGLIVDAGGSFTLTARGRVLARVFSVSSAWLGIRSAG
jgi:hypothetical protein